MFVNECSTSYEYNNNSWYFSHYRQLIVYDFSDENRRKSGKMEMISIFLLKITVKIRYVLLLFRFYRVIFRSFSLFPTIGMEFVTKKFSPVLYSFVLKSKSINKISLQQRWWNCHSKHVYHNRDEASPCNWFLSKNFKKI